MVIDTQSIDRQIKSSDPRLWSERFRQNVRIVLKYFGLESNVRNFRELDENSKINWNIFAQNITHPKQIAVVDILYRGQVTRQTRCISLPGKTEAEAKKKLDTNQYKFIRWF